MPKIHSRWLDLSEPYNFTGNVSVITPASGAAAANKAYVDTAILGVAGTGLGAATSFKTEQLTYTDFVNKVIPLSFPVGSYSDVVLFQLGGDIQEYGVDYTVRFIGSQAFICLDPTSTAPFGAFNGGDGSNPSVGVPAILPGDVVKTIYSMVGTIAGPNSKSVIQAGTISDQATAGIYTDIAFDTNYVVNGGFISHNTVTNNDNFVVNSTGAYLISYELSGSAGANLNASARVRLNDTTVIAQSAYDNSVATNGDFFPTRTFVANLSAGDFVTLQGLSNGGGNWLTGLCHFTITILEGSIGPQGIQGTQGAGFQGTQGPSGLSDGSGITVTNSVAVATTGSFADLSFDTNAAILGSDFSHSTSVNNPRITINATGNYLITYYMFVQAGSFSQGRVFQNGTTVLPGSLFDDSTAAGDGLPIQMTFVAALTAGDYITLQGKDGGGDHFAEISMTVTRIAAGPQGATGAGFQGVQGTNGSNGTNGTNGTNGVQGTNGTNGVQGVQGTNGTIGSNGTQGFQGNNGVQGVQGTPGSGGSDATTTTTGSVQLATGAQAFAGTPDTSAGGHPLVVQPSGLIILRDSVGNGAIYSAEFSATVPNARGQNAIDIQSLRNSVTSVASGLKSQTFGYDNRASLTSAMAIGTSNDSNGYYAITVGTSNVVALQNTSNLAATANMLMGTGNTTITQALRAFAYGINNTNLSTDNYVFGYNNNCNSISNLAIYGASTTVTTGVLGTHYIAGNSNTLGATAQNLTVTVGFSNTVGGYSAFTFGESNINNGTFNFCAGRVNTIPGTGTSGQNCAIVGNNNTLITDISSSFVVGYNNTGVPSNTLVFGSNSALNATTGIFVGNSISVASGAIGAYVFGPSHSVAASSSSVILIGIANTTNNTGSMAFGNGNNVQAAFGIALGYGNSIAASGSNFNTTIGNTNSTASSASSAQAFGQGNASVGSNSAAFGISNGGGSCSSVGLFGINNTAVSGAAGNSMAFGYSNTLGASASNATAFGYGNTVNNSGSMAFGNGNTANASYCIIFGYANVANTSSNNFNLLVGEGNSSIASASAPGAFGHGNSSLDSASYAFGVSNGFNNGANLFMLGSSNTVAAASQNFGNTFLIGSSNTAGTNATSVGYALGSACTIDGTHAFSFGINTVVHANYALAWGYANTINSSTANSGVSFHTLIGHQNTIAVNTFEAHIHGWDNTDVGSTSFVAGNGNALNSVDTSLVIGNSNTANSSCLSPIMIGISNTMSANSTNSNVFGRSNTINSTTSTVAGVSNTTETSCTDAAIFGKANTLFGTGTVNATVMGRNNVLGTTTVSGGARGIIYGFGNNVQADDGMAIGNTCTVSSAAVQSTAIGYGAQIRIPSAINFAGLPVIRHDGGESAGTELLNYIGMEVYILSKQFNFAIVQGTTITLPSGIVVFINEVGILASSVPTLTTVPTVEFGITGTLNKYLTPSSCSNFSSSSSFGERQMFTALSVDDAADSTTNLTGNITIASNATFNARFYWKVLVVET